MIKPGFWQVGFQDVQANGVSLGPSSIFNTPGIVDSGTPFLTLQATAFENLKMILLKNCSQNALPGVCGVPQNTTSLFDGGCFALTDAEKSLFPEITISFQGGASIVVSPKMYLIPMYQCSEANTVGLAIVSDPQFTVISGSVLLHFASVYDKTNMRVGFLPSGGSCEQFK